MKQLYILGSKINDISLNQTLKLIAKHLKSKQKGYIVTPNPEICLKAYQDKQLRRIILNSFLSISDGFGLKLGARIFGKKLNNITTGVDLTYKLLEHAEHNNYSILFFEGIPEIGDQVLKIVRQKYPSLNINFIDPGKVDNKGNCENKNLVLEIIKLNPDIIFVNFGAPKQEYFIKNNIEKLNTKLMIGNGGSFDFISGRLTRAPKIMRKIGFEWLYRLFKEPARIKRIINAVVIFPLACIRFLYGIKFIYRKNVSACIINNKKEILLTKHAKHNYWQFPQGGAKKSKTYQDYAKAVMLEMKDELGTDKFKILDWQKNCYKYTWPKDSTGFDHFKGQKQTLFLLKYLGKDQDIKLSPHEHSDWQWVTKDEILNIVPDMKIPITKIALTKFKDYL